MHVEGCTLFNYPVFIEMNAAQFPESWSAPFAVDLAWLKSLDVPHHPGSIRQVALILQHVESLTEQGALVNDPNGKM